jgi:hypothetical protein
MRFVGYGRRLEMLENPKDIHEYISSALFN